MVVGSSAFEGFVGCDGVGAGGNPFREVDDGLVCITGGLEGGGVESRCPFGLVDGVPAAVRGR